MNDIEIAKNELYEGKLTLSIIKNREILFETKSHRITGFLDAIESLGEKLTGASLADRVVGKAVALLCIHAGIKQVYAVVLSRKGQSVLKEGKVLVQWNELVDNILDENKDNVCPFERTASNISDPKEAYTKFINLREKLRACR